MKKKLFISSLFSLLFLGLSNTQISAADYDWKNVSMGGGGFVTGIITCPQEKNLIYARTDVGGAYRWVESTKSWKSITDWASKSEWTFLGVESIAIDPSSPNKVYMSVGLYSNTPNSILRSDNYGETFTRSDVSFQINGNGMGRGNGERLAVDPNNGQVLFCGSRAAGLWKSANGAVTWSKVNSFPVTSTANGNGISFVVFDETSGNGSASQRIYVGVSRIGADNVFVSEDGGTTWNPIVGQPGTTLMPQRAIKAGDYLYMTYADAEGPWNPTKGAVYRYNTKTFELKNIAPDASPYSGVTIDASNPNVIMLSTINRWDTQVWEGGYENGDKIYRSTDGGITWTNLCSGNHLKANVDEHPWISTKPKLHWVGDIRIDPFNSERVMITSGNGLFMTENISATKSTWTFQVNGLEETVPLDMVSIQNGPTITVVGDYNGFIHIDPTISPASGTIKSGMGTTTGVDFAENNPNFVAVVGNGNCKFTTNQGLSWTAVSTLPITGASAGSVAVSADGGTIFWYPNGGVNTYYTKDRGVTWKPLLSAIVLKSRPVTDRVNPNKVYLLQSGYIYECTWSTETLSYTYTTKSVGTGSNRLCVIPNQEGDIWVALNTGGLKHYYNNTGTITRLASVSTCDAIGFGKNPEGKNYPTLYMWGTPVGNVLGIYRSDDMGVNWIRVNDDAHEFGGPGNGNYIIGDRNVYGRVYMSTAGRGLIYGEDNSNTGIFSLKQEKTNLIYPNPVYDRLYCKEKTQGIEILGLRGDKLAESTEQSISVKNLSAGCYFARVKTSKGFFNQLFTKK